MARRKKRGVLTTLAKEPRKKRKRKKRRSPARRALNWIGGIVIGAALLVLVVMFVAVIYNPSLAIRRMEADVAVEAIEEDPTGYGPEVVALAVMTIEKRRVALTLNEELRAEVDVGTVLHVDYSYFPRSSVVRVHDWQVVP